MRSTYSVAEAAEIIGISRNRAYEAVRTGQIPSIRIGKRLLITKDGLASVLGGELGGETVPERAGSTQQGGQAPSKAGRHRQVSVIRHAMRGKEEVRVAYLLSDDVTLRELLQLVESDSADGLDWLEIPVQGHHGP